MTLNLAFIMPLALASFTLASTALGGITAFRFRDQLHLLLAFSAGAVIAVALFEMLPEVFAIDGGPMKMPLTAVGFLAFFGLAAMHHRGNRA